MGRRHLQAPEPAGPRARTAAPACGPSRMGRLSRLASFHRNHVLGRVRARPRPDGCATRACWNAAAHGRLFLQLGDARVQSQHRADAALGIGDALPLARHDRRQTTRLDSARPLRRPQPVGEILFRGSACRRRRLDSVGRASAQAHSYPRPVVRADRVCARRCAPGALADAARLRPTDLRRAPGQPRGLVRPARIPHDARARSSAHADPAGVRRMVRQGSGRCVAKARSARASVSSAPGSRPRAADGRRPS